MDHSTGAKRELIAKTEESMLYSDLMCLRCFGRRMVKYETALLEIGMPKEITCPKCNGVGRERRSNTTATWEAMMGYAKADAEYTARFYQDEYLLDAR